MQRERFVFYQSFWNATKHLPIENQKNALLMIVQYGVEGIEPDPATDAVGYAMFLMAKPQIDANNKRFSNGSKGGRPQKKETEEKPNDNQTITKTKPNNNQNVTEVEPNKEYRIDKDKSINKISSIEEASPKGDGLFGGSIEKQKSELLGKITGKSEILEEPPKHGNDDVNKVIDLIKKYNNGICDGTQKEQRQYAYLLYGKLLKVESVKDHQFSYIDILDTILRIVSENQYHSHKVKSPKSIYYDLAGLMAVCKQEHKKQEESSNFILDLKNL